MKGVDYRRAYSQSNVRSGASDENYESSERTSHEIRSFVSSSQRLRKKRTKLDDGRLTPRVDPSGQTAQSGRDGGQIRSGERWFVPLCLLARCTLTCSLAGRTVDASPSGSRKPPSNGAPPVPSAPSAPAPPQLGGLSAGGMPTLKKSGGVATGQFRIIISAPDNATPHETTHNARD